MNIFRMTKIVAIFILLIVNYSHAQSGSFGEYKNYAFPTALTSAANGGKIAWAIDSAGRRNVYVAEAPDFKPRKLTNYSEDDGQEITSLSISADGNWVVFVRGGEHSGNWETSSPVKTPRRARPTTTRSSFPLPCGTRDRRRPRPIASRSMAPCIGPSSTLPRVT